MSFLLFVGAALCLSTTPQSPSVSNRSELIQEVLRRNSSLETAQRALDVARSRVAKETTWEAPMVSVEVAPMSLSGNTPVGAQIRVSQAIPAPTSLPLRHQKATAEIDLAQAEWEQTRRSLIETTTRFWADFYVVSESLKTNAQHLEFIKEFKRVAEIQYAAGKASAQDVLQAEVEAAMLLEERLMLQTRRSILLAQLNVLLHRAPATPLPEPTLSSESQRTLPPLETVLEQALAQHPDVVKMRAELRVRQSVLQLSKLAWVPDWKVMSSYSSMWSMPEHRWMIGVEFDVPWAYSPRKYESQETHARVSQTEAALKQAKDSVVLEVSTAYAEVKESQELLVLYREKLLPPTKNRLEAARAGFSSGQNSFSDWIEAERALRNVELKQHQAEALLEARWAALDKTQGVTP